MEAELEAERAAFEAMNEEEFEAAHARAEQALACLAEPISPRLAADVHLGAALWGFWEQDEPATLASMQALLALKPHFVFGPPLAPGADHPLSELLTQAQGRSDGVPLTVDVPRGAVLRLDGSRTEERFSERAAVAQVLTDDGAVLWTGYVMPGEPLPPPELPKLPHTPRQRLAQGAGIGGAGLLVGGSAALVGGFVYRGQARTLGARLEALDEGFSDEDYEQLMRSYERANALGRWGQVSGLTGLALLGFSASLRL